MDNSVTAGAEDRDRLVLAYLGACLIAGGQPVNEVEELLRTTGRSLGYPRLQVAAAPTGITLALRSGAPATYEDVEGAFRLDQSVAAHDIRRGLEEGTLSPDAALERLRPIRALPARIATPLRDLGLVFVAGGLAMILAPGWPSVAASAVLGLVVALLGRLLSLVPSLRVLLPTVAAFVSALAVFALHDAGLITDPLRSILPPIAILLPGALLVTGMTELAAGHMMAGSSRLIYGAVQLMLFTLGVVGAAALVRVPPAAVANHPAPFQNWPLTLLGLALITVGILLAESVPLRLFGWIGLVVLATFGAQVLGQRGFGSAALGGLLGGAMASVGSGLVDVFRPRLPRLVLFLPPFWVLVPGSLGLLGFAGVGLRHDSLTTSLIEVVATVCAIALGVLVGAAAVQAVRRSPR